MNIKKSLVKTAFFLGMAGLMSSVPAGADIAGVSAKAEQPTAPSLIHTNQVYGPALHSYLNVKGSETPAWAPRIVYVSQAYGPAIYSYPRVSRDVVTAFNLEYVNNAYGPAIYSYPSLFDRQGRVEILPITTD